MRQVRFCERLDAPLSLLETPESANLSNSTRRELLALKSLTVLIVGDTSFKQEIRVDSNSTKPALEAVFCAGVRAQRPRVILNVGKAVSGQQ